jgi:L-serine dehydratase
MGHGTQSALEKSFDGKKISFSYDKETQKGHPNCMIFHAYYPDRTESTEIWSVGGGDIKILGEDNLLEDVYTEKDFDEIKKYCLSHDISLAEYVLRHEDIREYLLKVWQTMRSCISNGLATEGELPGGLRVKRRAKELFGVADENKNLSESDRYVSAYAFAAAEENAAGDLIATAPTCGSCGVIPAAFSYYQQANNISDDEIVMALMCAGVIGNVIKTNASISGAECGCQAEIGTACAMAAAGIGYLKGLSLSEIEYCAEMAIEHHLGLTCDPVGGLVQIPCIERNALAAMQAFNFASIAPYLAKSRKVDFDTIVRTMYETGKDLSDKYRETSSGGLAKTYKIV